jgi:hypothetical protein
LARARNHVRLIDDKRAGKPVAAGTAKRLIIVAALCERAWFSDADSALGRIYLEMQHADVEAISAIRTSVDVAG